MSSRDKMAMKILESMLWIYGTFRWCLLLGYSIISTGICIRIPDEAPSQYPVLLDEVQGLLPKIWDLEFPLHVQAMDWTIHWLDMKRKLKSQILTWCCDDCDTVDVQDYMFIDFMISHHLPRPRMTVPQENLPQTFQFWKKKHDSSIKFAVWLSSVKPEGRVCPAPLWSKVTIQKASPKMGHGVGVKKTEMTKDDKGILRISLFTVSCYIHQPNQETNKPRKNSLPPPDQKVADVWGCSHHQDLHVETKPLCRWDSPKPAAASVRMFA